MDIKSLGVIKVTLYTLPGETQGMFSFIETTKFDTRDFLIYDSKSSYYLQSKVAFGSRPTMVEKRGKNNP